MKKAISLIVAMTLIAVLVFMGTMASAAPQEVNVSEGDSLSAALKDVADGGKVVIDGTVTVTKALGTHNKTVTITGGTLDFTGLSGNIYLGDNITFDNITLTFTEKAALYACGYKVKMGAGVTMPNPIRIFGGKYKSAVESTNLTLLAGEYTEIYGGGNNGDVTGDTYLYVGGNVNTKADASSHSHAYCIYGGSYIAEDATATIGGTAYTVFTGDAKANYIYGGHYHNGTITGGTKVTVTGGSLMSIYGANRSGNLNGNVDMAITAGNMVQVFGGSENNSVTGDVNVDIIGGTITRRVYGGCYNNYDGGWLTSHYVNGNVVLTLHSGANITYSYDGNDTALYAHSRQKSLSSEEVSHLVYADSTAYSNYKNKVKAQDYAMKFIMGSTSAADHIHYHTYTASGAVITQNCIDGACSASATLVVEGTPTYAGTAVEPAKVTYSGNWFGGDLKVAYANNTSIGTGTASITCGGATASVDFAIIAPNMIMNGVGYGSLEDALAAARETKGVDTITLEKNLVLSSCLVIDTDVTITADKALTITAADSQTDGMIRIIDGTLTIEGESENTKIVLAAGKNTTNIISNNGGKVCLTNVQLAGNQNTQNNKACGIFNYEGTTTAKNVDVQNMMGDGIYVMDGTTVNLDNVTVSGSGRYGIKVKGTLNITNTVHADHALSVSDSADHAIDVEKVGKVVCDFSNVPADTYVIKLFDNAGKGLNVRNGGDAELLYVSGQE